MSVWSDKSRTKHLQLNRTLNCKNAHDTRHFSLTFLTHESVNKNEVNVVFTLILLARNTSVFAQALSKVKNFWSRILQNIMQVKSIVFIRHTYIPKGGGWKRNPTKQNII